MTAGQRSLLILEKGSSGNVKEAILTLPHVREVIKHPHYTPHYTLLCLQGPHGGGCCFPDDWPVVGGDEWCIG